MVVSKIAERLLIPKNCEFVRVPKLNEAKTEKFFHITKGLTEGYQTSKSL